MSRAFSGVPVRARRRPERISRVSYGRTVNVGNFESVRFDLEAEVGPGEDWRDVYHRLESLARAQEEVILTERGIRSKRAGY